MPLPDPKVAPTDPGGEQIPAGFSIVPHFVMRNPDLSQGARLLYVLIDGHLGNKSTQQVTQALLAREAGTSERTIQRWLVELRAAGLVTTYATGRSLILSRLNPSRRDTSGRRDTTPVSGPNRNNKKEITTTTGSASKPKKPGKVSRVVAADFLDEINKATGTQVAPTKAVLEKLEALDGQGLSPADVAALTGAYLSAHGEGIKNRTGFVASFVLDSLAAGGRPDVPGPSGPVTYMETVTDDPCQHGDPRGASWCALCRHAPMGSAV
jgi:hypothetical protein